MATRIQRAALSLSFPATVAGLLVLVGASVSGQLDGAAAAFGGALVVGGVGTRRATRTVRSEAGAPAEEARPSPLELELSRARRHGRGFALLCLAETARDAGRRGHRQPLTPEEWARRLRRILRETDRVWVERNQVFAVLPECDSCGVEMLRVRIALDAHEVVPASGMALVTFPDDGLTRGALLAKLHRHPSRPSEVEPADRNERELQVTHSTPA